jgi:pimeloyl-ACP methyl ester carboxylesterase
MHYQQKGTGKYTFVLLHNAGGDSRFFSKQIDFLASLGKVVAIDLPGHGQSQSQQAPSVAYFAGQVIQLCNELQLQHIIGIGLNYGANILLEINAIKHEMLYASIMIDPPIFLSKDVTALIDNNIHELKASTSAQHAQALVNESFIQVDAETKHIALQAFSNIDNHYLAELYKNLLDWDKTSEDKVKQVRHKSLLIITDAALCSMEDMQRVNASITSAKVVA